MKTEKDVKIDQEKTRIKEEIDFFAELSDDPKFIKTFMFQILKAHNEGSRNLFRFLIKKLGETPKVNPILGKKIGSLIKEYINYSQIEVEVLEPNISPISTQGIADIMKDLEEEDDLEDEKEDIDDLEEEEWDENDDDDPDPDLDDEDRRAQDIDEIFEDEEDEEDEEEEKPPEVIDRGYTELVSNSKVVKPESIVKPTRPVNPRKTVRIKTRKL